MNTGIIASRYATALLKLVDENGSGEIVVAQARMILDALASSSELRRAVTDPLKTSVILSKTKDLDIAPEMRRFLEILARNGRLGDIALALKSFEDQYYQSRGIIRGTLILPSEPDGDSSALEARIKTLIEEKTGKTLLLSTVVDPSIIGGFVLEVEDKLLDASVSRQLEIIRRQFVEKNRRIV